MEDEQTGLLRQLRIKLFKWDSQVTPFLALQELHCSSRGGFGCAKKYRKDALQGDGTKENPS